MCISESMKQLDQEFMMDAQSIAFARDARKSKLVIRFVAVNSRMVDGKSKAIAILQR